MAFFGSAQKVTILCPGLTLDGFPLDGLVLDVSISEQHTQERTATAYPVESGGFLNDHLKKAPRRLEMSAYLTDTPAGFADAVAEALRNLQTAASQATGAPVVGPLASTRSKDMHAVLELLADRAATCDVVTDLLIYESMVMLRLSVPRSAADGRGLRVDMTFQRLVIARTSTREGLTIDEPTAPSPEPTKKVKKTVAKPVAAPERRSSVAARLAR